ncbi:MAG: RES family NAD+ phosphorylase [Pseudomonadota bacterium]
MALPIWIPDALRSKAAPLKGLFWRCVESQHLVSTLRLVDTLDDQALLEDILEDTKPPVPAECEGLHWLYMTPFRYGLYPNGSRFRKAGRTPGVYYVSKQQSTAVIETAFHLLLFYAESPETPFPQRPTEHTCFDVPVAVPKAIDLRQPPFSDAAASWRHPTDYSDPQALEAAAREHGIEAISYASVRDPSGQQNCALLTCAAFAATKPSAQHTWKIWLNKAGLHALRDFSEERFSMSGSDFAPDTRFTAFNWDR